MNAQIGSYGHALGQANMVGYLASFLAMLPLEQLVADLDDGETRAVFGAAAYDRTLRHRIRDREAAAILLDAKRQLIALYAAYMASSVIEPKIRDSRPPLPVPLDPVNGAEVDQGNRPLTSDEATRMFMAIDEAETNRASRA